MVEAAFAVASRLFRLEFKEVEGPRYHPDVRIWEVSRDGEHVAVFIGDYFAREGKHSGAWCTAMRSQSRTDGDVRPLVLNVCNFAKPPEGKPALLSWDDARTLFRAILQYRGVARDQDLYESVVDLESRELFAQLLFSYKINAQTALYFGFVSGAEGTERFALTPANRTLFAKFSYAWLR